MSMLWEWKRSLQGSTIPSRCFYLKTWPNMWNPPSQWQEAQKSEAPDSFKPRISGWEKLGKWWKRSLILTAQMATTMAAKWLTGSDKGDRWSNRQRLKWLFWILLENVTGVGTEVKTDNSGKQLLSSWQLVPGPSVFPSSWRSQTWQVEITCLHKWWCTWFPMGWRVSHWVMSVTASEKSMGQWESISFIGTEVSSLQRVSFTDTSGCYSRCINSWNIGGVMEDIDASF